MAKASVRVKHLSEGWREILSCGEVAALCSAEAEKIKSATGHPDHYQVADGTSSFGGGRAASYVESADDAGFWLQATQKTMERAVGS